MTVDRYNSGSQNIPPRRKGNQPAQAAEVDAFFDDIAPIPGDAKGVAEDDASHLFEQIQSQYAQGKAELEKRNRANVQAKKRLLVKFVAVAVGAALGVIVDAGLFGATGANLAGRILGAIFFAPLLASMAYVSILRMEVSRAILSDSISSREQQRGHSSRRNDPGKIASTVALVINLISATFLAAGFPDATPRHSYVCVIVCEVLSLALVCLVPHLTAGARRNTDDEG